MIIMTISEIDNNNNSKCSHNYNESNINNNNKTITDISSDEFRYIDSSDNSKMIMTIS